VEGVGDHGCEYMTGGVVVILGHTGSNFAAGMSGGYAFVYDVDGRFPQLCNHEMVELVQPDEQDALLLQKLIDRHFQFTGSTVAKFVLDDFENQRRNFVKVFPVDFRKAIEKAQVTEKVI
jgi:glutamate synthase (NADPH/NADH) large chain